MKEQDNQAALQKAIKVSLGQTTTWTDGTAVAAGSPFLDHHAHRWLPQKTIMDTLMAQEKPWTPAPSSSRPCSPGAASGKPSNSPHGTGSSTRTRPSMPGTSTNQSNHSQPGPHPIPEHPVRQTCNHRRATTYQDTLRAEAATRQTTTILIIPMTFTLDVHHLTDIRAPAHSCS